MVGELGPVQSGLHHGNDIEKGGEEELLEGAQKGGIQLKFIRRGWMRRLQECHLVGAQTRCRLNNTCYFGRCYLSFPTSIRVLHISGIHMHVFNKQQRMQFMCCNHLPTQNLGLQQSRQLHVGYPFCYRPRV